MRKRTASQLFAAAITSSLAALGCGGGGDYKPAQQLATEGAAKTTAAASHDHDHDAGHDHDHDTAHDAGHDASHDSEHDHDHDAGGPHGGSMLEFGAHEYHAEFVLNETQSQLQVYVLGPDMKAPVSSPSKELRFNSGAEELVFKAVPQADDPAGTSSVFIMDDKAAFDRVIAAGYLHGTLKILLGANEYTEEIDLHFSEEDTPMPEPTTEPKPPAAPAADE